MQKARLVLVPAPSARSDLGAALPPLSPEPQPDGSHKAEVPWPLDAEALRELVEPLQVWRRGGVDVFVASGSETLAELVKPL